MNTKFLNISAVIFIVASSLFGTSCTDYDEGGYYPLQDEPENIQKNLETRAKISEDAAEFYDIKATYKYNGVNVEENLQDLFMDEKTRYASQDPDEELTIISFKKYGFSKTVESDKVGVTITATPKSDAIARVEAMPDDSKFIYFIDSETRVNGKLNNFYYNKLVKGCNTMSKAQFLQHLRNGEKLIESQIF